MGRDLAMKEGLHGDCVCIRIVPRCKRVQSVAVDGKIPTRLVEANPYGDRNENENPYMDALDFEGPIVSGWA
jgi:hypothetical protein